MGETVPLAGALVDRVTGLTAMPMAAAIGIIALLHSVFDVISATSAPTTTGIQRREASTTVNRLAMNHTPLIHSVSLLTHAHDRGPDFSAAATARPNMLAILIALHGGAAMIARLNIDLALQRAAEHVMHVLARPMSAALTRRGSYATTARKTLAAPSPVMTNVYLHVVDTSASRVQQTHTQIRGMGKQVCFADTAP